MTTIVPVVEGPGDISAFPSLLGRILWERYERTDVIVAQGTSRMVKANGRQNLENKLGKFLHHALNKPECDAILVLLDTDDDCPVNLAQGLLKRCEQLGLTSPVEIVCAHRSLRVLVSGQPGHHQGPTRNTVTPQPCLRKLKTSKTPSNGSPTKCPLDRPTRRLCTKPRLTQFHIDIRHGPPQLTLLSPAMSRSGTVAGQHILSDNLIIPRAPKLIDQPVELTYHSCHRLDVTPSQPRERFRDPRHCIPIWKSRI